MTRPTVLLLITTFDIGGAERVVIALANGLARRGFRVIVGCLQRRSGTLARELSGVEVADLAMASKWDVGVVTRLTGLLRAERVDVVYTFLLHASLVGRIAARLAGTPVVLSSQQIMDWDGPLGRLANTVSARACTRVVAVSSEVASYLVRDIRVPPDRVVTICNCVDPARFAPADVAPPDAAVFGMVARLNPEKDHPTLIEAFHRVHERWPAARLVLAGEGPERDAIAALVRNRGLDDAVSLLGHLDDVREVLGGLDVYVQASQVEGLPVAVLEAMSFGRPVIASRVGGNADAVEHGVTGLIVPPRDPAALATAMEALIGDPHARRAMGAAGRARVEAHFSADAMVAQTDTLIRALLAKASERRQPAPGTVTQ